ncbi:hypothetical protein [Ramlibacter sp.]|uniref:hypothetical protein n=1 Tax=Ramlibacter sp. TaxID=1917967 RepID=UPI0026035812|nr:hypothetical protein [Ramlibacter sp.]MDB5957509.1 hypothetical protein [Ramlibacter sp.]
MSNLRLRGLREAGVITGQVLPFARVGAAAAVATRHNEVHPDAPWIVMIVEAMNSGDYWVVSEEDAQRLEAKGYTRYVTKQGLPETWSPLLH